MSFLELSNIRKQFSNVATPAVQDFNLKVEKGEFVSFLGPSGCGKTTTLRMIAGFEHPTSGSIVINGKNVIGVPANKRKIGMVFQSYALFPNMTVADNIGFGLRVAKRPKAEIEPRVAEMLKLIHLSDKGKRYPAQLSGGQQQRVALARALAIKPELLLLDEPLSALDAKIRVSLRNEIRAIQRQTGVTAIYVTHDQEEAMSLSDRIVVMSDGRMEQVGTPFEIYNFPQTQFVASFVGTLNQVQARVVDPSAGTLEVEGQPIVAAKAFDARKGETIAVALRPEMMSLDGKTQDDAVNRLVVTVEETTFLGSIVRTRARLRESVISFDTFNNPNLALPQRGEKITVAFPREAILLLKPSNAATENLL
ncbi:MAG: Spermidine/putrescine import ATP-binding protein PotA [Anaerolineae bacterium]|nr:Spermidine/putrescine import ATP-binding protein PotA [Anaerolineae bacterium]